MCIQGVPKVKVRPGAVDRASYESYYVMLDDLAISNK